MVVLTEGLVAGTEQSQAKPTEGLNFLGETPFYPGTPARPLSPMFEAYLAMLDEHIERAAAKVKS